jgi:catechol 2,3-dioxygenase-like lactoylglutathione lyase family enzyme
MQIEIIRQENDALSPYSEWRKAGSEGVHHVCVKVDDLDKAAEICRAAGAEIVFSGEAAGTRWFYADTGGGPGTILEVVCFSPQSGGLQAMIRDAARDWDGSDPIRRLAMN